MSLSVIVPYVNEYPQNIFTIAALHEELQGIDHEIIAVCNGGTDKGKQVIDAAITQQWLKSVLYDEKLSCWNARHYGVEQSEGEILFFSDAHCIPGRGSLSEMYRFYKSNHQKLNGTIHLPLTYQILEWRRLIYQMVSEPENGILHYRFLTFTENNNIHVPCMSTCGMMITRELYKMTGGYPKELGIYGGGENFMNYVLAILGKVKWIFGKGILRHHGEKRGYSWNYGDFHRNRMIATYCFGGTDWLFRYADFLSPKMPQAIEVAKDVMIKLYDHRCHIKNNQKLHISNWIDKQENR